MAPEDPPKGSAGNPVVLQEVEVTATRTYPSAVSTAATSIPKPGGDPRNPTSTVLTLFNLTGGLKEYIKNKETYSKGTTVTNNKSGLITDTKSPDSKEYNIYVNDSKFLKVDEYENFDSEKFVNFMLGSFILGNGAENYIFPKNGIVSNEMKKAGIFLNALEKFKAENAENIKAGKPLKEWSGFGSFGVKEQLKVGTSEGGGIMGVPNMVGSAFIMIKPTGDNSISVSIFNITSITSGDLEKHLPWNNYPIAKTRVEGKQIPFSNISQFYSFDYSIK
jgi:hypothetical protein